MTTVHAAAGYLPGLAPAQVQWQPLAFESGGTRLEVAVPVLSPQQMTALALPKLVPAADSLLARVQARAAAGQPAAEV